MMLGDVTFIIYDASLSPPPPPPQNFNLDETLLRYSALLPLQLCLTFKKDQSSNYLSVYISAAAAGVTVHISTFILIQPGCVDPTLVRLHFYESKE